MGYGINVGENDIRYIVTDNKAIVDENLDLMSPEDLQPDTPFSKHVNTFSIDSGYMRQTVQQASLATLASIRASNVYRLYAIAEMLKSFIPDLNVNPPSSHPVLSRQNHKRNLEDYIENWGEAIKLRMEGENLSPPWTVQDFRKEQIRENIFDPKSPSPWLFCAVVLGAPLPIGDRGKERE